MDDSKVLEGEVVVDEYPFALRGAIKFKLDFMVLMIECGRMKEANQALSRAHELVEQIPIELTAQ